MKIALMGATGFLGSKMLQEALDRGHTVTAVSRDPTKLPQHPNLRPAKAEVTDVPALTQHFQGQDAIIHSYAPSPDPTVRAFLFGALQRGDQSLNTPASYVPEDMAAHKAHVQSRIDAQTQGTRCIIAASKAAGVKRILAVGGAGTLLVNGVRTMDSPSFPVAYEGGAKSTAVVKDLLKHEHDLEWTVLSPPMVIAPGERTGKFRLGLDDLLVAADGSSKISLEDFAMAMIDELERPTHTGHRFTIAY